MATEARRRATKKYNASHYDRVEIKIPKGQKQILQDYAASRGESLSSLLWRSVRAMMEKEMEEAQ